MIEEPELALHPQAQRYFHRILTELADREGCQVIYSTHSPTFVDATRFESVRLLRRPAGQHARASYVSDPADVTYLQQHREAQGLTRDMDVTRSELLFAERVLLVEGPGDVWAVREVADKLGFNLDGEGLSVVSCGGKSSIPFFARFCLALDIEFVVMHDEDIYDTSHPLARDNNQQQATKETIVEAMGGHGQRFVLQPTLEELLGIGRSASNKPRRVLEAVQAAPVDDLPAELVNAVKALADIPPF
jgi:predicted ATP-dependent endonuclease of OLD family